MSDWLEKFLGLMDGVVVAAKLPALKGGGAFDGGALVWHWHWEKDDRRGQLLLQARPDSYGERINIVLTASAWLRSRNDVLWTWAYDPPSSLSMKAADPQSAEEKRQQDQFKAGLIGKLAEAWQDAGVHFERLDALERIQNAAIQKWKDRGVTIR